MVWWLANAALAGTEARLEGESILGPCLEDAVCARRVREAAADVLRDAALGAEPMAVALSPSIAGGPGLTLELAGQSLAMPGLAAPAGVGLAPVVPKLGIGGVGGDRIRAGGGIVLAAAVPTAGGDSGYAGSARLGVVVGDPDGRRWVGFEADGGFARVAGQMFEDPQRAIQSGALSGGLGGIVAPPCPFPCADQVLLVHGGLDSVASLNIDQNSLLAVRLGGVVQQARLDVAIDDTRWRWSGFSPRLAAIAAYRPHPRALLAVAARVGLIEPSSSTNRTRLPWTGTASLAWRFGPEGGPSQTPAPILPPTPAAPAAPPPVVVPRIPVAEHPDVQCTGDQIPTGAPPPVGLKGWCATVAFNGLVVQDGAFVEWYPPREDGTFPIRTQGTYTLGAKTGIWREFEPDGSLKSQGAYVDGLRDGKWITYDDGKPDAEGAYQRGQQTGEWVYWGKSGSTRVGWWLNGNQDGLWREYAPDGSVLREWFYRNGILQPVPEPEPAPEPQ